MSELTNEQRAMLIGSDARMQGYYIGFDPTGNEVIDQILSAVAYAAKGAHSTEYWTDDLEYGYGPVREGKSFEWLIQEAANDAAERLTQHDAPEPAVTGWEYAVEFPGGILDSPYLSLKEARHDAKKVGGTVYRRRRAGRWAALTEGEKP